MSRRWGAIADLPGVSCGGRLGRLKPVPQQLPERVIWDLSIGRRGYERETYEEGRELLPELHFFGWLRFHRTLK